MTVPADDLDAQFAAESAPTPAPADAKAPAHAVDRRWEKAPDDLLSYIDDQADAHPSVRPELIKGIAEQESGWDPDAQNPTSSAHGLMQFIKGTAGQYGVDASDPRSSIDGAYRYMGHLLAQHGGDETAALKAYGGAAFPGDDDHSGYAAQVQARAAAWADRGTKAPGDDLEAQFAAESGPAANDAPRAPADLTAFNAWRAGQANLSPDTASAAWDLAQKLNRDPTWVAENLPDLQKTQAQTQQAATLAANPGLAEQFADPVKASIIKDDMGSASWLERLVTGRSRLVTDPVTGAQTTDYTAPGIIRAFMKGADPTEPYLAAKAMLNHASASDLQKLDALEQEPSDFGAQNMIESTLYSVAGSIPFVGEVAGISAAAALAAPAEGAAAVVGATGAIAAGVLTFAQNAGPLYRRIRQAAPDVDHDTAFGLAVGSSAIAGGLAAFLGPAAFEAVPVLGKFISATASEGVTRAVADKTIGQAITTGLRAYGGHWLAGVGMMTGLAGANSIAEQYARVGGGVGDVVRDALTLSAGVAIGPAASMLPRSEASGRIDGQHIVDESWKAAKDAASVMAVLGAWGPASEFIKDRGRLARVAEDGARFDSLSAAVKESKVSDPQWERVIAELRQSGIPTPGSADDGRTVYVSLEAFDAVAKSKGATPGQLAGGILDDNGQGYQQAQLAGAPIAVPIEKYASRMVRSGLHDLLRDDVKWSPDGFTNREATAHKTLLAVYAAKSAPEAAEASTIRERVYHQTLAAGRSEGEAQQHAAMMQAIVLTHANRFGLSPEAAYQALNVPEIHGPGGEHEPLERMPAPLSAPGEPAAPRTEPFTKKLEREKDLPQRTNPYMPIGEQLGPDALKVKTEERRTAGAFGEEPKPLTLGNEPKEAIPFAESDAAKEEREGAGRVLVSVDAKKLADRIGASLGKTGEKLAWNPERAAAASKFEKLTEAPWVYPRNDGLDVEGRHRVAEAAKRGGIIQIQARPEDVAAIHEHMAAESVDSDLAAKLESIRPHLEAVAKVNPALDEVPRVKAATDLVLRSRAMGKTIDQTVADGSAGAAPATISMAHILEGRKSRDLQASFGEWARRAAVDPRQATMFDKPPTLDEARAILRQPSLELDGSTQRLGQPEAQNLVVQHNLTEDNLAHADMLGGLPAPSIAIANVNHPLEGFGEISLLGRHDVINPKTTPVFDADVYSPRAPRARYNVNDKPMSALVKELVPSRDATGGYLADLRNEIERKGKDAIQEPSVRKVFEHAFLKEQGVAPEPQTRAVPLRNEDISNTSALRDFFEKNGADLNLDYGGEYHKSLSDAVHRAIDEVSKRYEGTAEDQKDYREVLTEQYFHDADGLVDFNKTDRLVVDHGNVGKTEPDTHAMSDLVEKKVNEIGREKFNKWAEEKIAASVGKPYLSRETAGGNEIKKEYTLDNIVREMTRQIRGAEGFNYGVGTARAGGAEQFKSIEAIKKARARVVSTEEFAKIRGEIGDRASALAQELGGNISAMVEAIGESYKRGHSVAAELKKSGFAGVSRELVEKVQTLAADIVKMPTEYFEAKPQRAVGLGEFAHAVIPENARPETRAILEKHGLSVSTYDPAIDQDRRRAIADASSTKQLLFQGDKEAQERGHLAIVTSNDGSKQYRIHLGPGSDASTLAHETIHWLVDTLSDQIAKGNAPEDVARDHAALLKWAGYEGERDPKNLNVAAEEKIAAGWEKYLMDGNAPTKALDGVFGRFARWMTKIYSAVKGGVSGIYEGQYKQPLDMNEQVRGIFDRILATSDEIEQDRASREPAASAGAGGGDGAAPPGGGDGGAGAPPPRKPVPDVSRDHARSILNSMPLNTISDKFYRDAERRAARRVRDAGSRIRESRAITEERGKIGVQVTKESRADQAGKALDLLQEKGGAGRKLDRKYVRENMGEAVERRLDVLGALQNGYPIHPNDVANDLGFSDAHVLAHVVLGVPDAAALDKETERRLREKFPVNAEIRKAESERSYAAALGDAAKEILAKAKDQLARIQKIATPDALTKIAKSAANGAGTEYIDVAQSLLETIGVRQAAMPGMADQRAGIPELLARLDFDGRDPNFDPEHLRQLLAKPQRWGALTPLEAQNVHDALTQIRTAANGADKVMVGTIRAERRATIAQIADESAHRPDKGLEPVTRSADEGIVRGIMKITGLYNADNLKPEEIASRLGPTMRRLWETTLDGRNAASKMKGEVLRDFIEKFQPMMTNGDFAKMLRQDISPETMRDLFSNSNGVMLDQSKVNVETLMMAFLNLGTKSSEERLLGGYKWDKGALLRAIGRDVPKQLLDMGQEIMKYSEEKMWPLIAAHVRELNGVEPQKLEKQPIVIRHADGSATAYDGGYFAAKYNSDASNFARQRVGADNAEALDRGSRATVAASFTKARANRYTDVIDLNWSNYPAHMNSVMHYLAYDEPVRSLAGVFRDREFRDNATRRIGAAQLGQLDDALKTIARGRVEDNRNQFDKTVSGILRSRAISNGIGFSFGVAAQQVPSHTAYAVAAGKISAKNATFALSRAIRPENWNQALEKSAELQYRGDHYAERFREALSGHTDFTNGWKHKADVASFAMMDGADRVLSHVLWDASYRDALEGRKTFDGTIAGNDAAAVEHADRTLRELMPTHNIFEMAASVRNPGTLGALQLFRGLKNVVWNVESGALDSAVNAGKGNPFVANAGRYGMLAARLLGSAAVLHLLGKFWGGHGKTDDDGQGLEGWATWAERNAAASMVSLNAPWGGEVAEGVSDGLAHGKTLAEALREGAGQIRNAPVLAQIADTVKRLGVIVDSDKETSERVGALTQAILSNLGAAANQAAKTGGYIRDVATGDQQPRGPGDVLGGLLHGSPGVKNTKNFFSTAQDIFSGER